MPRSRSWSLLVGLLLVAILPGTPAAAAGSGGWNPLGHGATANVSAITDKAYVLESVGGKLYVGGQFENAGGIAAADRIAVWNGSAWSAVGAGIKDGTVYAIAVDQQTGDVYAGGSFNNAGDDADADALAVWTGSAWHSVSGVAIEGPVFALKIIGRTLYIAGGFANANGIAAADAVAAYGLDSHAWSAVTDGDLDIGGTPSDIEPDGAGGMFVSGNFIDVDGTKEADFVAHYTGGTAWSALGAGPSPKFGAIQSQPGRVWGLAVSGTDVYAVGEFINVFNGLTSIDAADKIAKWNGSSWSALGSASFFGELGTATPYDLVVDGSRVIVVGAFLNTGGNAKADGIATFSGGSWSNVGTDAAGTGGPAINLRDVAIVGSKLYVAGLSPAIGGGVRNDFVAFYRLRQPDATIATTGAAAGNDVYNTTGASQAKSRSVPQGGSGSFAIKVSNDGLGADSFTIRGPGSGSGFTVKYIAGTTDVTSAVVAGSYTISGLAAGASRTITLKVAVGGSVHNGASRSWLVTATSTGAGAAKDAVKATVTAS